MIQYKCDMCGKEALNKKDVMIIDNFPRKIHQHVTDGNGVEILPYIDIISSKETHFCMSCCCKLADTLPIIEEK